MNKSVMLLMASAVAASAGILTVQKVEASSTLSNQGKNSYVPENLVDGDVNTVWAASFKGQPITLELSMDAYSVNSIEVINGYRRDKKSYENNSRVKTMNVYINSKSNLVKTYTFKNIDWSPYLNKIGVERTFFEALLLGEQISFPTQTGVKKIILEITSVYPGKKWKDVCLGDVLVIGAFDNPLNQDYRPETGTVTDARDQRTYKTIKMGERTWLAENLSYNVEGSYCYDNKNAKECGSAGRLYSVDAVRNNQLCPSGWHLANKKEFMDMNQVLRQNSYRESMELSYKEAFAQGESLNGFGLNYYTLEMCQCYDAGCDGDVNEMEQESVNLYRKIHTEKTLDYMTGFWTEPTEYDWTSCGFEGTPVLDRYSYVRYGAFWGGPNFHHTQCGGDENCLVHAITEDAGGAKELFVRCVKD